MYIHRVFRRNRNAFMLVVVIVIRYAHRKREEEKNAQQKLSRALPPY